MVGRVQCLLSAFTESAAGVPTPTKKEKDQLKESSEIVTINPDELACMHIQILTQSMDHQHH